MKKYLFLLLLILIFPLLTLAQGQSGPNKFIPRYFAIENTAQYPEYLFFAVIWDLEPKLIVIETEEDLIGGNNTGSQVTLYYGEKEKFTKESLAESIKNFQAFHEIKNLDKFSYPIKLNFWEVSAISDVVGTINYLRVKDLNQLERIGPNKEYLVLEDTKLVINKEDGSKETQNLLLNTDSDEKKRLPIELAIFISIALPLLLLWFAFFVYGKFKKRKK